MCLSEKGIFKRIIQGKVKIQCDKAPGARQAMTL